jgi:hypothetical protein
MGGVEGKKGKESHLARLFGSGTSGVLELLGFHPVDTVAKRLMSNTQPVSFIFLFSKLVDLWLTLLLRFSSLVPPIQLALPT